MEVWMCITGHCFSHSSQSSPATRRVFFFNARWMRLFSPQLIVPRRYWSSQWGCLAPRLTLKMNVLMLMYFSIHVGVSVRVNVSVNFRVDFRGDRWASLGEEELLLCQVLLIVHGAHAVFLRAGGAGRRSRVAPVPLSVGQLVGALQYLCGRSWRVGRGAVFSALAEPQEHSAKDEHYSSWDPNDDRPGEGAGGWWENGRDGRLRVCRKRGPK